MLMYQFRKSIAYAANTCTVHFVQAF